MYESVELQKNCRFAVLNSNTITSNYNVSFYQRAVASISLCWDKLQLRPLKPDTLFWSKHIRSFRLWSARLRSNLQLRPASKFAPITTDQNQSIKSTVCRNVSRVGLRELRLAASRHFAHMQIICGGGVPELKSSDEKRCTFSGGGSAAQGWSQVHSASIYRSDLAWPAACSQSAGGEVTV